MKHPNASVRRPLRSAVRWAVAALVLTAVTTATPALASAPEQWERPDPVSPLSFILVLVLIPAGLFLVISLLTVLPSMARGGGSSYQPGLAWRNEPAWFGGPRRGVTQADEAAQAGAVEAGATAEERGGASAHW